MCGVLKEVGKTVGGLLGVNQDTPTIVRETPAADASANADKANSEAAQAKLAAKRRRAAASLLATGGSGDSSSPVTGLPAAQGKQQLGT